MKHFMRRNVKTVFIDNDLDEFLILIFYELWLIMTKKKT